jgi:NADH dehydrogenase [ubiquinone] 1 alpha subcomplex assembly factor 1
MNDSLFKFHTSIDLRQWRVVDDSVMGGISQGNITLSKEGNGVYYGDISIENNGGFSSLRHQFKRKDVSDYNHVSLRIKGDGKSYQFRIKSKKNQGYSYVFMFKTSGDWDTIILPFKDFTPQFRGRVLNRSNYSGEIMEEIAFLIGNKVNESFELQIKSIVLIK